MLCLNNSLLKLFPQTIQISLLKKKFWGNILRLNWFVSHMSIYLPAIVTNMFQYLYQKFNSVNFAEISSKFQYFVQSREGGNPRTP